MRYFAIGWAIGLGIMCLAGFVMFVRGQAPPVGGPLAEVALEWRWPLAVFLTLPVAVEALRADERSLAFAMLGLGLALFLAIVAAIPVIFG